MASLDAIRGGNLQGRRFSLGMQARQIIQHSLAYLLIAAVLIIALMPSTWMFSTSFKKVEQLRITVPIQWLPHPITLENFVQG